MNLHHQRFRTASARHRSALQSTMASRAILQMDEAAPAHQIILRHFRKRSEDPGLDRHDRLRPDRDPTQENGSGASQPLADLAGFELNLFRENDGEFTVFARNCDSSRSADR
jgi:hypothetical protein